MPIYIEHNAKTLGAMLGIEPPGCDGVIARLGDPSDVLASTIRRNPLGEDWLFDVDAPGDRIVSWSGTLADSLFESHPLTWSRPGHVALARFCDEIHEQLEQHERMLCFQPHARHVLSDPQSCLYFLSERSEQRFEIAFAPASVLEATMIDDAAEHVRRGIEALGPRCAMVILHDVRVVERDGERALEPAPLGQGVLPRESVLALLEEHVPDATPIVISPEALDSQLAWLEAKTQA